MTDTHLSWKTTWRSPRGHCRCGLLLLACKQCIYRLIHGFIIWTSALYLCTVFVLWLENPDWQVKLLFSHLSLYFSSFPFFFAFLVFSSPLQTSAVQKCLKILCMRIITRNKALHSAAMPPGPVVFLCLVSCPIPFRQIDERPWCTQKKKGKEKQQMLFIGGWGKKLMIVVWQSTTTINRKLDAVDF